ncbi:putative glyceraldehyde-3-phosphate dehydrogenase (NADP(+)) (phosphorylating) [Helianthus anomalus]
MKQASHFLKYDSTLGIFDANPSSLPWKELGIDLVIKGTGVSVDKEGVGKHIEAGAKKVLITSPGKGDILTYVVGVNADLYNHSEAIISNAFRTTNCLAPFAKIIDQNFGNHFVKL